MHLIRVVYNLSYRFVLFFSFSLLVIGWAQPNGAACGCGGEPARVFGSADPSFHRERAPTESTPKLKWLQQNNRAGIFVFVFFFKVNCMVYIAVFGFMGVSLCVQFSKFQTKQIIATSHIDFKTLVQLTKRSKSELRATEAEMTKLGVCCLGIRARVCACLFVYIGVYE